MRVIKQWLIAAVAVLALSVNEFGCASDPVGDFDGLPPDAVELGRASAPVGIFDSLPPDMRDYDQSDTIDQVSLLASMPQGEPEQGASPSELGSLTEAITIGTSGYGSDQGPDILECGMSSSKLCLAQKVRGTITYKDDKILAHGCAGPFWENAAIFGIVAIDTQLQKSANGFRLQLNPVQPNDGANIDVICCTNKTCGFAFPKFGSSCPIGTFGPCDDHGLTSKTVGAFTYLEAQNWQVSVNGDIIFDICFNKLKLTQTQCQQFARNTFAHEISHALGLGHDVLGAGRTLMSEAPDLSGSSPPAANAQMLLTAHEMQELGGFLP